MNKFDSLILKFFYEENVGFFEDASLQKIQQPSRHELVFTLRNFGQNKKFYININPDFYHVCFIDEIFYEIPKQPPMFCMLLRKYLSGAKIKRVSCPPYERILEFYFDYIDELNETTQLCLSVELMGKYSNIILYNAITRTILGSIHNVSKLKSSVREIYGGIPYVYPNKQEKKDILLTPFSDFNSLTVGDINQNYFYLTKPLISLCAEMSNSSDNLFSLLKEVVSEGNKDIISKLYGVDFDSFNDLILKYHNKNFKNFILDKKKKSLISKINGEIKQLEKIFNESSKISDADKYKTYAELILSNLYLINEGDKYLTIGNDKIKLDPNLKPSQNAQKYFDLYKKAKNAKKVLDEKKEFILQKKKFLKEKIFFIENATSIFDLEDENNLLSDKKSDNNNILNPINFLDNLIYIGKSSKQNSILLSKIARPDDFWFHLKDMPSCHVILKNPNKTNDIMDDVLLYCAKLVKENSSARNSGKVSVIYTKRKYLSKQTGGIEGLVIYSNEKEIVIE